MSRHASPLYSAYPGVQSASASPESWPRVFPQHGEGRTIRPTQCNGQITTDRLHPPVEMSLPEAISANGVGAMRVRWCGNF